MGARGGLVCVARRPCGELSLQAAAAFFALRASLRHGNAGRNAVQRRRKRRGGASNAGAPGTAHCVPVFIVIGGKRMTRVAKFLGSVLVLAVMGGYADMRSAALPVPQAATSTAPAPENSFAAADAQILAEIRDHSELMANLEYLSDRIGPRLTGSPLLKTANDWTAEMFRKYGLTDVHLEAYSIPHAWVRGVARARILAPTEHPLTIASAAWSPN